MKRLFVGTIVILALSFAVVLIIQNFTEAQPPAPPKAESKPRSTMPRQNFGAMIGQALNLPGSWWYISVGIGISDEQLIKARPIYEEAWKKEQVLRKKRPQNREERQASLANVKRINSELSRSLKAVLTGEQFAKYDKWEKKRQERLKKTIERRQQSPNRQQQKRPKQLKPKSVPEEKPQTE